jgi:hypothetical protein
MLAAALFLVWLPARERASAAEDELGRAGSALAGVKYRLRLATDYEGLSAHTGKLERKLRQAKADPEFVHDIEALAAATGVNVAHLSSRRKEQSGGVSGTAFEFSLSAPYANIRRFIAELANLEEFTVIERVTFDKEEQTVKTALLLLRLQKTGEKLTRN